MTLLRRGLIGAAKALDRYALKGVKKTTLAGLLKLMRDIEFAGK